MLKSWLFMMAAGNGNGTPSSGSPAQEAVWPGESEDFRPRLPQIPEEDDKAMKIRGAAPDKPAFALDKERWACGEGRAVSLSDVKPAYFATEAWMADRGEQCLI